MDQVTDATDDDRDQRRQLSRNAWIAVLAGLAAALPTLVYIARGGGLLLDDWLLVGRAEYGGFLPHIVTRPVGYTVYALEFLSFGETPWPHLLILAVANAAVAILLWRVAAEFLPRRYAVAVIVLWLVLPNRSSTHYWATGTPNLVALALVIWAVGLTLRDEVSRRDLKISCLLTVALLTYEGSTGIAAAVLVVNALRWSPAWPDRLRRLVVTGAAPAAASLWVFVQSPRNEFVEPFYGLNALVPSQLGSGIFPDWLASYGPLLLLAVAWAALVAVLPSFRLELEERLILIGAAVMVLGVGPFLVAGFPLTTTGINDRANLFASVGLVLVMVGSAGLVARLAPVLFPVVVGLLVIAMAPGAWADMDDYLAATRDGEDLAAAVADPPAGIDLRTDRVVVETLPNRGGVSFVFTPLELQSFLAVRLDGVRRIDEFDGVVLVEPDQPPPDENDSVRLRLEGDRFVAVDPVDGGGD